MPGPELQTPWQMLNVLGVILGGGRGTRLYPLTRDRAKPAVPLLGQYRLIDIPISNCLNSGISRIYVLTQFNSESLLRHIANTYKFDVFSDSWVEVLPAQQTHSDEEWYQGPADAVRQNLHFFAEQNVPYVLILSGDQLYRMDFRHMLETHMSSGADATISCLPVSAQEAPELGLVKTDDRDNINAFAEKPTPEALEPDFRISPDDSHRSPQDIAKRPFLASMGIYLFNTESLIEALSSNPDCDDFGAGIIPSCVGSMHVRAHRFDGYWEDIGTIGSFYRANLHMARPEPAFDFYVQRAPVYTHPRFLPPPRLSNCEVRDSLIGAGSRIQACTVAESVVGLRANIGEGSVVERSIIMGQDFYETEGEEQRNSNRGHPPVGIGPDSLIENCIIDKNARIGQCVRIPRRDRPRRVDDELYSVRDGVVVIPKNTVIPDGTEI